MIRPVRIQPAFRRLPASRLRLRRGLTLVEVMVSFGIFTLLAGGLLACFLRTERLAKSNLAQAYAEMVAQSVVEQVVRLPIATLTDTGLTDVEIKLAALNSSNRTTMESANLPWAADATTFTDIGTTSKGVLVDAAYIANSNTIRPEKYMRMRMNLQRDINMADGRVVVTLRYQWEIPDRKNSNGTPIYLADELKTVRSTVASF